MLQYQTMNELHVFLKEHQEMATKVKNKNLPNTAPILEELIVITEIRHSFIGTQGLKLRLCLYQQCMQKATHKRHVLSFNFIYSIPREHLFQRVNKAEQNQNRGSNYMS